MQSDLFAIAKGNAQAFPLPYGAAASVAIAAAKHGKKILLALLAILAIPLLFLVMLPTLIFGGTAQNAGDTTILNDQSAITENMNEIAFAVSDLLGSGIADAEQRIADDFAASGADQYRGVAKLGIDALVLKTKGFDCKDIAVLYHTSSNNVGAWISRAAKKLRSDPDFLDAFDIAC